MPKDDLTELAQDLRKRAATCRTLAGAETISSSTSRLLGKAAAYTHAAELAEALVARDA
jgi:hypothetical protein